MSLAADEAPGATSGLTSRPDPQCWWLHEAFERQEVLLETVVTHERKPITHQQGCQTGCEHHSRRGVRTPVPLDPRHTHELVQQLVKDIHGIAIFPARPQWWPTKRPGQP